MTSIDGSIILKKVNVREKIFAKKFLFENLQLVYLF